ncbi:phospholipase D-like domain-containing protein [soil metagenome]
MQTSDMNLVVLIGSVVAVLSIAAKILALGLIPNNRRPSSSTAWLLAILLAPVFGFVAFFFFGSTRIGRKRHQRQREAFDAIAQHTQGLSRAVDIEARESVRTVVHLNSELSALPAMSGNSVEFIEDYATSIAMMTDAIGGARSFVHIEFYITALDDMTSPLIDALEAAAARGVPVRMLFDHLGSRGIPGYKALIARLEAGPIEYRPMLPIKPLKGRFRRPDLRNHRKLLVIDDEIAFTGSQNLTEPSYNKPKNHELGRTWVELMVRVEGPIVAALDAVFASDWYTEADERLSVSVSEKQTVAQNEGCVSDVVCQLVPSGPGFVAENNLRMFTTLIYAANDRISLTSPYFVPDESLLYAVTTAAMRGIDVELFVSEVSDQFMVGHAQNSYYHALLEAGVRVYLYPAPLILHSKHFTVDDDVAVIGSSNMDMRSFGLNYEISLLMLGEPIVDRMRLVEDHYRAISKELLLAEWNRRPARQRYVDNVMRLTSALQ